MSCKEEYQRYRDLKLPFANAYADWEEADRNAFLAASAAGLACLATLVSIGGAGPACIAALSATAIAATKERSASAKLDAVFDARFDAFFEWLICDARSRSVPSA